MVPEHSPGTILFDLMFGVILLPDIYTNITQHELTVELVNYI